MVPEGLVDPAVKALVEHDLALIPLLHDREQLDSKIAETLSVLQDDAELNYNLVHLSGMPLGPALVEHARLRAEVERIDPMEVDELMPIFLEFLSPAALQHCVENRSFLASRYNVAKKELIRRQEELHTVDATRTTTKATTEATSNNVNRISTDDINIDKLASLPVRQMISNVSDEEGEVVLIKLGVNGPDSEAMSTMRTWSGKMMTKPIRERRKEIAKQLVKKLEVSVLIYAARR